MLSCSLTSHILFLKIIMKFLSNVLYLNRLKELPEGLPVIVSNLFRCSALVVSFPYFRLPRPSKRVVVGDKAANFGGRSKLEVFSVPCFELVHEHGVVGGRPNRPFSIGFHREARDLNEPVLCRLNEVPLVL